MSYREIKGHGIFWYGKPLIIKASPEPNALGIGYKNPHYCGPGKAYCNGTCTDIRSHINIFLTKNYPAPLMAAYGSGVAIYVNDAEARMLDGTAGLQLGNKTVAVWPNGVNCKKCNMKNEYGEPNQADKVSYVCYMCR